MRVGDKVWYCKKLKEPSADGNQYSAPIEITTRFCHFTVMDARGFLDIKEFGENISEYATAIAQPYSLWVNEFHEGDLFYINGNMPNTDEDWYGENANFIVDNVDNGNARIKLTLKRVVD